MKRPLRSENGVGRSGFLGGGGVCGETKKTRETTETRSQDGWSRRQCKPRVLFLTDVDQDGMEIERKRERETEKEQPRQEEGAWRMQEPSASKEGKCGQVKSRRSLMSFLRAG